jgi:hypothetical protein
VGGYRCGVGVSVDDDSTTGTIVDLEDDIGFDTEEEPELPFFFVLQ